MSYALLWIAAAMAGPVASDPPAAVDPDKKICRAIVPTGSIMPKRFCLTKKEWKELGETTGASAEDALHRRGTGMKDGGMPASVM